MSKRKITIRKDMARMKTDNQAKATKSTKARARHKRKEGIRKAVRFIGLFCLTTGAVALSVYYQNEWAYTASIAAIMYSTWLISGYE